MSKFPPGVTIDMVPTGSIALPSWDEIWQLTRAFYDAERAYVEQKLREHQRIVLFRSRGERALVGSASVDVYPVSFRDCKLAVIYTSHVLLEERYRGLNLLQRVAQFPRFLAALRSCDAGVGKRAHESLGAAHLWRRLAARARHRGALRPQAAAA